MNFLVFHENLFRVDDSTMNTHMFFVDKFTKVNLTILSGIVFGNPFTIFVSIKQVIFFSVTNIVIGHLLLQKKRVEIDRNIEVAKNYDPTVPEMLLDEKKIKQVFMNLIMNAKHAIGDKGTLSLSTGFKDSDHKVFIKITDTGYGIEKKNLARIFDPFFTTKSTGEGTGLGLSVSYGIIKNHGGDILVKSEIGKGSAFTIVLPLARTS